jgi:MinD superfamily P-loop ATPase
VDLALIVTEPTLSGLHDLERVAQIAGHFKIKTAVVINKFDINAENASLIEKKCREKKIEVLAKIPFDETVEKALLESRPVVEYKDSPASLKITELWTQLKELMRDAGT